MEQKCCAAELNCTEKSLLFVFPLNVATNPVPDKSNDDPKVCDQTWCWASNLRITSLILFSEIIDAHKGGKIASFITVESGHSIGTSLGVLRTFQRLGVRALTLTHNCDTPW